MKSADWLRSSREEQFARREQAIAMLDEIGPYLERINPGAAEEAYRSGERMRRVNEALAARLDFAAPGVPVDTEATP